jgi:hypothetical protein
MTVIEDLVSSHVYENCNILATFSMNGITVTCKNLTKGSILADTQRMRAAGKARNCFCAQGNTDRHLGVLTKPDKVPSRATKSKELWLDIFEER